MLNVLAETNLLGNLEDLTKYNGVSVGLVIGQVASQRTFVVHLAPTPEQSKETYLTSLTDVDEGRLGEHARYVTRMLPGGLWVLGIFVVSQKDYQPNSPVWKKVIQALDKSLSNEFPIQGVNPSGNYLVLHYNGGTKKYHAVSASRNWTGDVKNVNWKFESTTSSWCQIATKFNLTELFFESNPETFPQQLKNVAQLVAKDIGTIIVKLEGKKYDDSDTLDKIVKANGKKELEASLFKIFPQETSRDPIILDSAVHLQLEGFLPSRVYLHPKCTVNEAARAIRQDITRSLAARLEMHCDSLVDEAEGSPEEIERVHVPPRRVLFRPNGWFIEISDFLFPGESTEQTTKICQELLDLEVDLLNVFNDFEVFPDGSGYLSESSLKGADTGMVKRSEPMNAKSFLIYLGIVAAAIAIISHFIFKWIFDK